MQTVTIYYLEMTSPIQLIEKPEVNGLYIIESEAKQFQSNKSLYHLVGDAWNWTDKNCWTDAQWQEYAENQNLQLWIAYWNSSPAGYYELQKQDDGDVEIVYFGLIPEFIGQGFGGYLLTHAIRSAWACPGAKRVWVHTCSDDHPAALRNYLARGMKIYNEEVKPRKKC